MIGFDLYSKEEYFIRLNTGDNDFVVKVPSEAFEMRFTKGPMYDSEKFDDVRKYINRVMDDMLVFEQLSVSTDVMIRDEEDGDSDIPNPLFNIFGSDGGPLPEDDDDE